MKASVHASTRHEKTNDLQNTALVKINLYHILSFKLKVLCLHTVKCKIEFQLTVSTYLHYHEYCSLRNHFASIVFW
jgi:hypothetical protein